MSIVIVEFSLQLLLPHLKNKSFETRNYYYVEHRERERERGGLSAASVAHYKHHPFSGNAILNWTSKVKNDNKKYPSKK